ncbi:hypothetical protein F4779DRAFT_467842 [Xylariaceae sp. FL0662B]|nr:hypothetical protein F4779DRAFT_467842 [Xylariaceae sp. FL0662B]
MFIGSPIEDKIVHVYASYRLRIPIPIPIPILPLTLVHTLLTYLVFIYQSKPFAIFFHLVLFVCSPVPFTIVTLLNLNLNLNPPCLCMRIYHRLH